MKSLIHFSTRRNTLYFFVLIFSFIVFSPKVFAATNCTILTKNLVYGATNSTSDNQVTALQNFLHSKGYLASSPTGRFGSLTTTAVKKFQQSQSISSVGSVGPITRVAIQKMSCSYPTTNIPSPVAIQASATPTQENDLITMPSQGLQLTTGQKYTIEWTGGNDQSSINILLEYANGAGAGYVASNLSGTDHYTWTVGNVSIANTQTSVATPGSYRLRVVSNLPSGTAFNEQSGIFNISESPLSITSIQPSIAPNDGKTEINVYGSGFGLLSRLSLSGPYPFYNLVLVPNYVSPDGKLLWFYVPQYITPNMYQISVYNNYSYSDISSATSTPSNYVPLQVSQ